MEKRKIRWIDVRELDYIGDKGEHTLSVGYFGRKWNKEKKLWEKIDEI